MIPLISTAAAADGAPPPASTGIEFFIMIGIFFVIMYFMIIRPQSKRAKEHKKLIESLSKGDEVVTNGGVLGRITQVSDSFVGLEVSDGVELKLQKGSVSSVMPKGTLQGE